MSKEYLLNQLDVLEPARMFRLKRKGFMDIELSPIMNSAYGQYSGQKNNICANNGRR